MTRIKILSSTAALVAAVSMAATPVAAAEHASSTSRISVPIFNAWDSDSENAQRHRGYRHRGYRGYRHRNRVDAGDVIAGVLILGGIAAIANAASRKNERRYDPRYDSRYRDRRGDSRYQGGEGIDRAVDMCLREIERDVRVQSVDNVDRNGSGWSVTGTLYDGEAFRCSIDNNGRVGDVSYGDRFARSNGAEYENRQYGDDRYAEMRRRADTQGTRAALEPTGSQPAYPGGPVDGDIAYDDEDRGG